MRTSAGISVPTPPAPSGRTPSAPPRCQHEGSCRPRSLGVRSRSGICDDATTPHIGSQPGTLVGGRRRAVDVAPARRADPLAWPARTSRRHASGPRDRPDVTCLYRIRAVLGARCSYRDYHVRRHGHPDPARRGIPSRRKVLHADDRSAPHAVRDHRPAGARDQAGRPRESRAAAHHARARRTWRSARAVLALLRTRPGRTGAPRAPSGARLDSWPPGVGTV